MGRPPRGGLPFCTLLSAIGTKRTFQLSLSMSAFAGKADIIHEKADMTQIMFNW
jgi:hypothetical protein